MRNSWYQGPHDDQPASTQYHAKTSPLALIPPRWRVYDPCCGTGGLIVQSGKFIDAHKWPKNDIAIYGQEWNHSTLALARMNLAIQGIFADIRWNSEGNMLMYAFPHERFDYILVPRQPVLQHLGLVR